MGDNGVAGPPAKKRVAPRQLSKDDGSDSEGEAPATHEDSGAFQRASEEVMAARRIVKVRRPAPPPSSAPNPFAGIRLVPPSSAAGEPVAVPVPIGASVPVSTESGDSMKASSASLKQPGSSEDSDVKELDITYNETEPGTDVGKFDQIRDGNLDAVESTLGVIKAEERRFPETEELGDAKQSAVLEEQDKTEKEDLSGALEVKAGNKVDDEKGSADQVDGQGKEKQSDRTNLSGKKDLNDQLVTEKQENPSVQTSEISTAVSTSVYSEKVGFAGSLGSIGTDFPSSSFSFGTAKSSFGTPTGFASFRPSWSFGSGSDSGLGSVSAFSFKASGEGTFSTSSSAFGSSNGGAFQLFGSQSSAVNSATGVPSSVPSTTGSFSFQEVPLETGEEQEKVVFAADATLFEFSDNSWRERGKGEVRVNVPEDNGGRSRLVMRSKGNYRLLLNASLFPDIKMASMDSRGVTFACVNSVGEGKNGLTTYAVKLKDSLSATGFREAVDTHKGKPHVDLKTPENSPRAPHETARDREAREL